MVSSVVGLDEIYESNIGIHVVVVSHVDEGFESEESISAAEFWCPTKLELGAMFI